MNDYLQLGLIILFSIMELLILSGVLFFYLRLRNSERLLPLPRKSAGCCQFRL